MVPERLLKETPLKGDAADAVALLNSVVFGHIESVSMLFVLAFVPSEAQNPREVSAPRLFGVSY
jgi:hypothetical protein